MKKYVCFILVILLCCVGVAFVSAENTSEIQIKRYYYKDDNSNDDEKKWFEYYFSDELKENEYLSKEVLLITKFSPDYGEVMSVPANIDGKGIEVVCVINDFEGIKRVELSSETKAFYFLATSGSKYSFVNSLVIGDSFDYKWHENVDYSTVYKLKYIDPSILHAEDGLYKFIKLDVIKDYELLPGCSKYVLEGGAIYTADKKALVKYVSSVEMENFKLPSTVEEIGFAAFAGNSTLENFIGNSVLDTIGRRTFDGSSVRSVLLDKTKLKYIPYASFRCNYDLRRISFPKSITRIGKYAFDRCKTLKSSDFPKKVKKIDYRAFYGCSKLKKVSLKEGIRYIGGSAFRACSKLKRVNFPKSLRMIAKRAFVECNNLRRVTFNSKKTEIVYRALMFSWIEMTAGDFKYKSYRRNQGAIIVAPKGSKAQEYAKKYKFKFSEL